jgi:hypothetical protein
MLPLPPPSFGYLERQTAQPRYSGPVELYYQLRYAVFTKFPSWLRKNMFPQPVYYIDDFTPR